MRRERTLPRFALLCACLLALSVATRAQDLLPKLDEYAQAAAKAERFSGAILVARDGKILVSKGYGMADVENDVPNTPETKFRLGSLTKQFTAASILLLQERGKLSVQDSICKYVAPCPEAWQPVTIHHLLSHTGGVPNFTALPDYQKTMREAARTGSIARDLSAIAFGEKYELPVERVVVKVDSKIYDAYVGEYELAPDFIFTVTREGDHLMMQATGQGKAELFPTSETNFFPKVVRADITFVKDTTGRVTHLVLNQNGRQMNAKKIK